MLLLDQARRYLAKIPPAISGAGGHDQTFTVACRLIWGFGLAASDARPLMLEYSTRCVPPWSEKEIDHKLADAERNPDREGKPRGYLLRSVRHIYRGPHELQSRSFSSNHRPTPTPAPVPSRPCRYDTAAPAQIPEPVQDGARALLRAAFEPGEGIRIVMAYTNDEGREAPQGSGIVFSREEWLKKLDEKDGDINRIMRSAERNGIYVTINPMQIGGDSDGDVTAFRHVLIEWDHISLEEQWNLITQSRIPATAVIYSGGDSLHAWVKVDARDRAEYDQRVKILYTHFEQYKLDKKNVNPSRFSRLPNCMRFDKRQELLALHLGADSFTAWQMEQEAEDLGEEITIESLLEFDPDNDPNNLIGNRWICKGYSFLWIGQTHIGKSSLAMQMAILWALERPAFGICPVKPIRSLIVQAENDVGDMACMFQGVWRGMNLPGGENPDVIRTVKQNLRIRTIDTLVSHAFCKALQRLIDKEKPDLVWIDPVLAFVGDDISKQTVVSNFFRQGIARIAKSTGAAMMLMLHTGKPSKDPKSKSGWTSFEMMYEGIGSSDLPNWARGSAVLKAVGEDNLFELRLCKRGQMAGARDPQNNKTKQLWLRRSDHGICWLQTDAPTEEALEAAKPKSRPGRKPVQFDNDEFLESIRGEHFTLRQLAERITKFSGTSERTAWRSIIPELKKQMKLDSESRTYSC